MFSNVNSVVLNVCFAVNFAPRAYGSLSADFLYIYVIIWKLLTNCDARVGILSV